MKRPLQGRYVTVAATGEAFQAFIPSPLPPRPAVKWTPQLRARFDAALLALGRLDATTDFLPNASLVLYSFVRKEAVLSSMIEGTQSSLSDLLLFELDEQPGVPVEDAREVSRYVSALEHGLKRLRGGFPLCSASFAKYTKCCLVAGVAGVSRRGSFGGRRCGWAARVQATPYSCRPRRTRSRIA